MKKINRGWAFVSFVLITSALIGTSIGMTVNYFIQKHKANNPSYANDIVKNLGPAITYKVDWLPDLEIKQYPYKEDELGLHYFYSKNEIKKLFTRLQESLNYGPEIFNVREVFINDISLIDEHTNGIYYPGNNSIGLRIDESNINNHLANDPIYGSDYKIERGFEILYHEYGHHIFYTYVSSPYPDEKIEHSFTYNIDGYKDSDKPKISKEFLNWFKQDFNYNNSNVKEKESSHTFINPISEEMSLQENFNYSNEKYNNNLPTKEWYSFIYQSEASENLQLLGDNMYYGTSSTNLKYLYSIDELLTRKYLLATMPVEDMAKKMLNPNFYQPYSIGQRVSVAQGTLLEDYSRYSTLYYNEAKISELNNPAQWEIELEKVGSDSQSDYLYVENYYDDDPFNYSKISDHKIVAQQFSEKMALRMGTAKAKEVSLIIPKNSFTIVGNFYLPKTGYEIDEANKIKIGGYLNNQIKQSLISSNQSALAIKNEDESFTKISDISLQTNALEYKNKVFEDQRVALNDSADTFWITNDFSEASTIENKELYFIWNKNDKQYNHKLTSYRGDENSNKEGVASSYLNYYVGRAYEENNLWRAQNSIDGGVIIANKGSYLNPK